MLCCKVYAVYCLLCLFLGFIKVPNIFSETDQENSAVRTV